MEVAGGVAIVDPVGIVLKPNLRTETVKIFSIHSTHTPSMLLPECSTHERALKKCPAEFAERLTLLRFVAMSNAPQTQAKPSRQSQVRDSDSVSLPHRSTKRTCGPWRSGSVHH